MCGQFPVLLVKETLPLPVCKNRPKEWNIANEKCFPEWSYMNRPLIIYGTKSFIYIFSMHFMYVTLYNEAVALIITTLLFYMWDVNSCSHKWARLEVRLSNYGLNMWGRRKVIAMYQKAYYVWLLKAVRLLH